MLKSSTMNWLARRKLDPSNSRPMSSLYHAGILSDFPTQADPLERTATEPFADFGNGGSFAIGQATRAERSVAGSDSPLLDTHSSVVRHK